MKKINVNLAEKKLAGIIVRTKNIDETNPNSAKILPLVTEYFQKEIYNKIINRKNPGITLCGYYNYESDEHGEYDFFIGEEVTDFQDNSDLTFVNVPASKYTCITTEQGAMPEVVIKAWQEIWQMKEQDFGGKRTYIIDFEVYDQRAVDRDNTVLDIYVGIK